MLFTGRIIANAEVTAVKGDKQVVNFSVAINQRWTNKEGDKKEKAAFVNCAYWRNAGIAEYLAKGAVVEISGWLEAQGYKTNRGDITGRLICTCDNIRLFSVTAKVEQNTGKPEKAKAGAGSGADEDDDLPF
jgi:single-strand DNA-binding protein